MKKNFMSVLSGKKPDTNTAIKRKVRIGTKSFSITFAPGDHYNTHIAKVFEPEMVDLFAMLIDKQDQIFDVGANIGCTALAFAGLGKSVHAFEPSPSTSSF